MCLALAVIWSMACARSRDHTHSPVEQLTGCHCGLFMQVCTLHCPAWQVGRFCGQTLPHLPQLLASVSSSASQPLPLLPSQLPYPGRHESSTHWLFTHAV